MNKIKLDSANIALSSTSKLTNVVINLEDQIQDVAVSITRLDTTTNTGTIKYDSVIGGYTSDLQQWRAATTWPSSSTQGQIPAPNFATSGATFVVEDPTNPNPKTVDQSGHVLVSGLHFMEVEVDVVVGEYHNSVLNGTGTNVDVTMQNIGYVAKFRDTITNQIHTIFIDQSVAKNISEAITQATNLIQDKTNWDKQSVAQTLNTFLQTQKVNVSNVGVDASKDTQGVLSAYDTLKVNQAGIKLEYNQDGSFDKLVGLASEVRTSIDVEEQTSTSGKQIFIVIDENERHTSTSYLNGQPIDPTDNNGVTAGKIDFDLFNDPDFASPELLKLFQDNNVTDQTDMALIGVKDVADKNTVYEEKVSPAPMLMSRSASSSLIFAAPPVAPTNVTIPLITLSNGRTLQLTPATLPAYLKMQWASEYEHKGGLRTDPFYLFLKQLVVTYDAATGMIIINDPSNGKYGYKEDAANSKLNFGATSNAIPAFIEIVNPTFITNVEMTIHTQNQDISENMGNVVFDQMKGHWTGSDVNIRSTVEKGLSTPKDLVQRGSNLKFESSQTSPTHTPRFVLTTDGTFKPIDKNGLTWTQDTKNPNVWYGVGTTAEFTDTMPGAKNTIKIEAQSIIKPLGINVNVVDGLNNHNLGTSNTIHLNVDLFTNNIQATGADLNTLKNFQIHGKNVLESIGLDASTLSKMLRTNQKLTESILDSSQLKINHNFIYLGSSEKIENGVKVLTINTSTPLTRALLSNPASAHMGPGTSRSVDLNSILHKIVIKIKDTHGHVLASAHAMQDPVTNEIILVDEHNHPIHLDQNIKTQILATIKNQVATLLTISLRGGDVAKYDFKCLYIKDSKGHILSSTLSGDKYKSTI